MAMVSFKPEAASRGVRMLRTAMGPAIAGWLEDPAIVEVILNPDGHLWIDRLAGGLADTGKQLSPEDGERIVRLVAHHVGTEVHPGSPRLSAELPGTGERFEGLLPPIVAAPAFAIRKPAVAIFTLTQYVRAGIMTAEQAEILRGSVAQRRNILVAGGTSTGKTTLVNALLDEVAKTNDRVVLIEDTRELQCKAPNLVASRGDVISAGEVRGGGGTGTLQGLANRASEWDRYDQPWIRSWGAVYGTEHLLKEVVVVVRRALIEETINIIAVLAGSGTDGRLVDLAVVKSLKPGGALSHRQSAEIPRETTDVSGAYMLPAFDSHSSRVAATPGRPANLAAGHRGALRRWQHKCARKSVRNEGG
jgi:type IV secretion system protein TrbB